MPEDNNEEQFMQRRLLLASVLSALALMGYFYMNARNAPPPPENPTAIEQTADSPAVAEAAAAGGATSEAAPKEPASTEPAASNEQPASAIAADAEQQVVVETDTYRVTFSNRGAVVTSWILKEYEDSAGEQLDLVHPGGAGEQGNPFRLRLPGGEEIKAVNQALFTVDDGGSERTAPASVKFEYANNGWSARKTFRFEPQGYVMHVETELRQNGEPRSHLIGWPGGFGDITQANDSAHSETFYYDPASGKPVRNAATDAVEQKISNTGPYPFVGIDDLFFTAVFSPAEGKPITLETWAVQLTPKGVTTAEGEDKAAKEETFAAAAVGGSPENQLDVFVGPKSIPILGEVSQRHRQIVNFGWLSFLALPLFYMLLWVHENMVANYGWAIVLVTVAINFVLFPLKWKSTKSMKRMQALQPLIKQINEKYKGLSMRDPKKAQQNEEMMALYKKYGVNPMGGCLPMVLQMPFFIAFYWVLTSAIEMRHASWLWVDDLSRPETLAIRVLPLAMIFTQFWQQHMTPQPTVDPSQARLMKFMPLMFGFFFYGFQSGLVLYWLTMNLVGVGQQALLNRLPSEPLEIEQPRRRKKKK